MAHDTGEKRVCESCGQSCVLCSSGGVHRDIICECGGEMSFDSWVKIEWAGQTEDGPDYKVIGKADNKFDY